MRTVLAALILFAAAGTALAQSPDRPLLLVAAPELQGVYSRTALLVVPAGGGQHVGFILNRATQVKLAALFPEHAPSAKVVDPVYFGGPEMVESIFAVVRRDPGAPSLRLFGELFVTANAGAVDQIIEKTPNDARYFAGFVGWRPGELADEIGKGYWYVAEPDAALVFRKDTGAMWEELMNRLSGPRAGPILDHAERGEARLDGAVVAVGAGGDGAVALLVDFQHGSHRQPRREHHPVDADLRSEPAPRPAAALER